MTRVLYVVGVGVAGLMALSGCSPTSPKGFDSPDPQERARAGLDAAEHGDRTRVPELIDLLENDDAAARLAAVGALRQMTGKEFGYDYLGTDAERAAAVDRWKAWLDSSEGRAFCGGVPPVSGDHKDASNKASKGVSGK